MHDVPVKINTPDHFIFSSNCKRTKQEAGHNPLDHIRGVGAQPAIGNPAGFAPVPRSWFSQAGP